MNEPLQRALREIESIERELRTLGDHATLRRFGDPDRGVSIAASLGHRLADTAAARVVDQLSRMPDGLTLVRDYLQSLVRTRGSGHGRTPRPRTPAPSR